jgi:hypothetical protein
MYIEHNSSNKTAVVYVDNGFTNVRHWSQYTLVNTTSPTLTCRRLDVTTHTTIVQSGLARLAVR